jgi:hypothetical protein
MGGIEPPASASQVQRSAIELHPEKERHQLHGSEMAAMALMVRKSRKHYVGCTPELGKIALGKSWNLGNNHLAS